MNKRDFFYTLPEKLIAQQPAKKRHMSRLMVLDRSKGSICHRMFYEIADFLNAGDCLVLNDTRVMPARLIGKRKDTGGRIEFLLLRKIKGDDWEVILKPGRRAKRGSKFVFGENGELQAEILDIVRQGNRIVRFSFNGDFDKVLEKTGIVPLPPYIKKTPEDIERYQTVYSREKGSAAAPTAGLHFTGELLSELQKKSVSKAVVTLHVGIGTFRPVREDDITRHRIHTEYYRLGKEAEKTINTTKNNGGRIIAVGTTSCRVLETAGREDGFVESCSGWTDIFIYPGYKFRVTDGIITNFHLPCSTLLMLVSAFAGRERILNCYETAKKEGYRFYSFGDAMMIL